MASSPSLEGFYCIERQVSPVASTDKVDNKTTKCPHEKIGPACIQQPRPKLDCAIAIVSRGWPVFPLYGVHNGTCSCRHDVLCESTGKHPRIRKPFTLASVDPQAITAWWSRRRWGDSNIGIPTGTQSGLIVLDIDNSPDRNGDESFAALQQDCGWYPETYTVLTHRGRHLYFRAPSWEVMTCAGVLGVGLDVRGEGGYVVAEGSTHASGVTYRHAFETPVTLETFPDCLRPLLEIRFAKSSSSRGTPDAHCGGNRDGPEIPEGARDATLFRIGCSLRGHGADDEEVARQLSAINKSRCLPPLGAAQISKITRSVCKFERGSTMSKASLHWFKKNCAVWAMDPHLQSLSDYQTGWYSCLEMAAYMGKGYLPDNEADLRQLARARSKATFAREYKQVLKGCPQVTVDGVEMLLMPSMRAQYLEAEERSAQGRAARMKGLEQQDREAAERNPPFVN